MGLILQPNGVAQIDIDGTPAVEASVRRAPSGNPVRTYFVTDLNTGIPDEVIQIDLYSDHWGPFRFDFAGIVPDGASITDISARSLYADIESSYEQVRAGDSSLWLIESQSFAGSYLDLLFWFPGTDFRGIHTLVFTVELNSYASRGFNFSHIRVF